MRKPTAPYSQPELDWIEARVTEARTKYGSQQTTERLRDGAELCFLTRKAVYYLAEAGEVDAARSMQKRYLDPRMWIIEE